MNSNDNASKSEIIVKKTNQLPQVERSKDGKLLLKIRDSAWDVIYKSGHLLGLLIIVGIAGFFAIIYSLLFPTVVEVSTNLIDLWEIAIFEPLFWAYCFLNVQVFVVIGMCRIKGGQETCSMGENRRKRIINVLNGLLLVILVFSFFDLYTTPLGGAGWAFLVLFVSTLILFAIVFMGIGIASSASQASED